MRASYQDIRECIAAEPLWYDENGTPRYAPFHPGLCADIYARRAVLLEIACQSCGQRFLAALSEGPMDRPWLKHFVEDKTIHYGDPPRHDCVGDTMNCDDLRVTEYWDREHDWRRVPEMEVALVGTDEAT